MFYLGIDQHRKQLTVNLRNEQGEVVLKRQVTTKPMWEPTGTKTRQNHGENAL